MIKLPQQSGRFFPLIASSLILPLSQSIFRFGVTYFRQNIYKLPKRVGIDEPPAFVIDVQPCVFKHKYEEESELGSIGSTA